MQPVVQPRHRRDPAAAGSAMALAPRSTPSRLAMTRSVANHRTNVGQLTARRAGPSCAVRHRNCGEGIDRMPTPPARDTSRHMRMGAESKEDENGKQKRHRCGTEASRQKERPRQSECTKHKSATCSKQTLQAVHQAAAHVARSPPLGLGRRCLGCPRFAAAALLHELLGRLHVLLVRVWVGV